MNYPACFSPQQEAAKIGYQQILWLLGDGNRDFLDMRVTEAGSMNFFVVVKRGDGNSAYIGIWKHYPAAIILPGPLGLDVITPPLDGTVLPGVTRESCITLLRSHSPDSPLDSLNPVITMYVHETSFTVGDMYKWSSESRLLEAFGVGTAVVVSGVGAIGLEGHPDIDIQEYDGGLGPVGRALYNRITDVQVGKVEFRDWGYACA